MIEHLEKVPGSSLIQIDNCVHEFIDKDTRHQERNRIYHVLERALERNVMWN